MRVIGLTGGIACGKSTVSARLAERGAVIVDGDRISRRLTAADGPALPEIRAAFGDGVFQADGSLDRKALGSRVFSDDAERRRLNGIMQPLILAEIGRETEAARAAGAAVCVLDMPLLFEEGLDRLCDETWCVWLPREIQLRRLTERDGLTAAEAEARIDSQLPTDEKAARADRVLDNSGSRCELMRLTDQAFDAALKGGMP